MESSPAETSDVILSVSRVLLCAVAYGLLYSSSVARLKEGDRQGVLNGEEGGDKKKRPRKRGSLRDTRRTMKMRGHPRRVGWEEVQ